MSATVPVSLTAKITTNNHGSLDLQLKNRKKNWKRIPKTEFLKTTERWLDQTQTSASTTHMCHAVRVAVRLAVSRSQLIPSTATRQYL